MDTTLSLNDADLSAGFQHYDADNSGYIDVRELAQLCAELGAPLTEAELKPALDQLDGDKSGRIEQGEFVGWWKGRDMTGSLGKKLSRAARAGKSKMLEAKEARKQAERDAQLLANRIALLKQEEAKALKKIAHTRQRAQDIVRLRAENEKRLAVKSMGDEQERESSKKQMDAHYVNKELMKAARKKNVEEGRVRQSQDVRAMKMMSEENQREIVRQRQAAMARAQANKQQIRQRHEEVKRRREEEARMKAEQNRIQYEKKLEAEDKLRRQREKQVANMEREELMLIQRLQESQKLQKSAYAELESALSGRALK